MPLPPLPPPLPLLPLLALLLSPLVLPPTSLSLVTEIATRLPVPLELVVRPRLKLRLRAALLLSYFVPKPRNGLSNRRSMAKRP
jgi:hypothetical protein